jgi:hypothetical protein
VTGTVAAVALDGEHRFSKAPVEEIRLIAGLGVEGDAHAGVTVQHRSRMARDPSQPNLRQVHLIHSELLDEVDADGFTVAPGAMGENVTTACSGCPQAPACASGTRRSWRSPGSGTRACRSTASRPD